MHNYLIGISAFVMTMAICGCSADVKSGVTVSASSYGDKWPLKAEEARLGCDAPDIAYIEVNGTRYALNGGALRSGLPRPDEIRKDANSIFMADFTEKAMQICLDKRK